MCKKLFSIIVSICLIITSLPAESLGRSFLASLGNSELIPSIIDFQNDGRQKQARPSFVTAFGGEKRDEFREKIVAQIQESAQTFGVTIPPNTNIILHVAKKMKQTITFKVFNEIVGQLQADGKLSMPYFMVPFPIPDGDKEKYRQLLFAMKQGMEVADGSQVTGMIAGTPFKKAGVGLLDEKDSNIRDSAGVLVLRDSGRLWGAFTDGEALVDNFLTQASKVTPSVRTADGVGMMIEQNTRQFAILFGWKDNDPRMEHLRDLIRVAAVRQQTERLRDSQDTSSQNVAAADVHCSAAIEPQEKYEKFKPVRLQVTPKDNGLHLKVINDSIGQGGRDRLSNKKLRAIKYLPHVPPSDWTYNILITPDTKLTEDGKRPIAEIVNGEIRYYPVVLEKDQILADLFNSTPVEARSFIESIILEGIIHILEKDKDRRIFLSCLPLEYLSANFKILSPFNKNKVSCPKNWYRQIKQRFVLSEVDLNNLSGRIKGGVTRYPRLLLSKTYANVQKIVADKTQADAYGFESKDRGIFGPTVEEARYTIEAKIKEWHDMGIRVMLHSGIGGQALGNRALLEPAAYNLGWDVIVLEKLGYDFNQIFDDLEEKGIAASQICLHASSKSGTTDETMINFQGSLKTFIMRLSKEKFGDERVGLELTGILGGLGDLTTLTAEEVEALNLSDKAKTLLQEVFGRIIFTTTLGKEAGSRLYAFARCELVRSILGPGGIPVVGIPDNIGGRFSERSPSGDVTSSFAGRDVFKISQGAREVLDIYTSADANINPALKAACYLYLLNPDYIVVAVQASNMRAVASALSQKFPESWGKGGKGPMVLVCVGQGMLDKMAQAMENYRAAFILINVEGEKVKPLVLNSSTIPYLIYTQMGLGEKEEARRLLFSDEFTKWFGELNAAAVTDDYRSSIYQPLDFQTQPFVDIGKKLMEGSAADLSRDEAKRIERYHSFFAWARRFPQLFRSRVITLQTSLARMVTLRRDIGSLPKSQLPGETIREEDEEFLSCVNEIRKLMAEQARCRNMLQTHRIDNRIFNQFEKIAEYGSSPQPAYIEKPALSLALLCAGHIIRGKIPLPIFYTHQVEAEILGRWYKYIMQNVPNEYGIGTREQHSYFQSLLGGKDVALPILVDVFTSLESVRQTQEPIWYIGLAKDYLKELYPDEVRRLYLEAEFVAFASEKVPDSLKGKIRRKYARDCAILRIWDLSTDNGLIEAFRFFGRFNTLLSEAVSLLHQEISIDGWEERLRKRLEEEKNQTAGQIMLATDEVLGAVLKNSRLLNPGLLKALSRQTLKAARAIWREGRDESGPEEWHTRTPRWDIKQIRRDIRQPYVLWNKIHMLQRLEIKRVSAEEWLEISRNAVSELINMDTQVAKNHRALFSLLFDDQGLPVYLNGAPEEFIYHQVGDEREHRKELKGTVPGRAFRLRGTLEHPLHEPHGFLGFKPSTDKESFLRLKLNKVELTEEDIKSFPKLAMTECIRAAEFFAPLIHPDKPLVLSDDFIEMFARAGINIPKEDLTVSKFLQMVQAKGSSITMFSFLGMFAIPSLAEAAGITVEQIRQIFELVIIVSGVGIFIWLVWDYIKGERETEREINKLISSFKSKVKSEIGKLLSSLHGELSQQLLQQGSLIQKSSTDKGSSTNEPSGDDKCASLGKDKRLTTQQIGQRAKDNTLKKPAEDIKDMVNFWIETGHHWDLREKIEKFLATGGQIEISSKFGALNVRVNNTIYMDRFFIDVYKDIGSITTDLSNKIRTSSFLFLSLMTATLTHTSEKDSLKGEFIEVAVNIIKEFSSLNLIRLDKIELISLLKNWAVQNNIKSEEVIIEESLQFIKTSKPFTKKTLFKVIKFVKNTYPEFKNIRDDQALWKDLALTGFKKSASVFEMNNWIDILLEIFREDNVRAGQIKNLFEKYFNEIDDWSGWSGGETSENIHNILNAYGDIESEVGLDGLKKTLRYGFVAKDVSIAEKLLSILSSKFANTSELRNAVLTYLSLAPNITEACDLIRILAKQRNDLITHDVITSIVKSFIKVSKGLWEPENGGKNIGSYIKLHTLDVSNVHEYLFKFFYHDWNKIVTLASDNRSSITPDAWQKIASRAFLEILEHVLKISENKMVLFNLFIGISGIEELYVVPQMFTQFDETHAGINQHNREGKFLVNSALKGIVKGRLSAKTGFIRIDPSLKERNKDAYLKRKLNKNKLTFKDRTKYEEIVVEDIIQAVSIVAQTAHADKKLRLLDSVTEMFKNLGIFLPEQLTIRKFTETVEDPEKYRPVRKEKPSKAVKFKEVRTPTHARYPVRITNPSGLHMMVAGEIVTLSENFKSVVIITKEKDGTKANARSLDELLMLAAGPESTVIIEAKGKDALNAAQAIENSLKAQPTEKAPQINNRQSTLNQAL